MRGATVVDTVMTLPPSGRGSSSSNSHHLPPSNNSPSAFAASPVSSSSGSNTLHAFGTMPRRGRGPNRTSSSSGNNNNNSSSSSPPPLETHFDHQPHQQSCDDDDEWLFGSANATTNRKISNAHSGSAPSLVVAVAAVDRQEDKLGFVPVAPPHAALSRSVPRAARHQSVERALVSHYSAGDRQRREKQQQQQQKQQQPIATKPKGLKKFLGRMRRSNSGTIHEEKKDASEGGGGEGPQTHLKRGGFRASAGSRFASWMGPSSSLPPSGPSAVFATSASAPVSTPSPSGNPPYPSAAVDSDLPFRQWKVETICSWLDHLGLYMYNAELRRHVKNGEQLLALSSHDLESKLGMRSGLHRKKVLLALQATQQSPSPSSSDLPGRLDHQWVVRWLDDVGLPQYKDAFLEARVDGRVLNFLTVEDLFQMKVTNLLHHLSIRRGIQVLRKGNFEPSCLLRRRRAASPEERERSSSSPEASEVSLWTNHRVMDWLRQVDLAEYAPNLRGSGVHGALLVLEPR